MQHQYSANRRFWPLFLLLSLCLFFTSCSDNNISEPGKETKPPQPIFNPKIHYNTSTPTEINDDKFIIEDFDNYGYILSRNNDTQKIEADRKYVVCIDKSEDRDFLILNLSDIQCATNKDLNNAKIIIRKLVSYKKPDLITITGDNTEYGIEHLLTALCDFLDKEIKIPWAPVFGNHDHEGMEINIKEQCSLFESYDYCLFRRGPNLGYTYEPVKLFIPVNKLGNYIINIVEDDGQEFNVVKSIYMMNSGSTSLDIAGLIANASLPYDNLNKQQLKFYNESINSVQSYGKNGNVNSALFLHIPIYKYKDVFNAAFKGSNASEVTLEDSANQKYWNEGYEGSFGVKHEGIGSSNSDDHVFDAIKNTANLVVCGHDHKNNFVINYQGVTFAYSLKSGTGNYHDPNLLGGTFISIDSDGNVKLEQKTVSLQN